MNIRRFQEYKVKKLENLRQKYNFTVVFSDLHHSLQEFFLCCVTSLVSFEYDSRCFLMPVKLNKNVMTNKDYGYDFFWLDFIIL